mgnify:CR=1 FL=1
MPYLRTGVATYFGFMPAEGPARTRIYAVSSSEGNDINIGDVVCYTTDLGTVRRTTGGTSTDAGVYVGVAASRVVAADGTGSTETDSDLRVLTSGTLLVYDDPYQVFVGSDTTSGVLAAASVGKAVAILSTGAGGSTGPSGTLLRSVQAISAISASSGSANGYRFKVLGLHPIHVTFSTDGGSASSSGETRKFLLMPAFPAMRPVDLGHVTT